MKILLSLFPYNTFQLPGSSVSGLETAGLVVVKAADDSVKGDNGKPVIRPYTVSFFYLIPIFYLTFIAYFNRRHPRTNRLLD